MTITTDRGSIFSPLIVCSEYKLRASAPVCLVSLKLSSVWHPHESHQRRSENAWKVLVWTEIPCRAESVELESLLLRKVFCSREVVWLTSGCPLRAAAREFTRRVKFGLVVGCQNEHLHLHSQVDCSIYLRCPHITTGTFESCMATFLDIMLACYLQGLRLLLVAAP